MYQNPTPYPSVTQVLSPFCDWSRIPAKTLEAAALRGTQVHDAIALHLIGGFPVLSPEATPYFESFLKWSDMIEYAHFIETRFTDETLGYTGQVDLVARLRGDSGLTVIDWKTGVVAMDSWRVQIAAYRHLVGKKGEAPKRGMTVRLKKDGSGAIVKEYTDDGIAMGVFMGALTAYNFFKPKTIDWGNYD